MPARIEIPSPTDALRRFADRAILAEVKPNITRYKPLPSQALFHKSQAKNRATFGSNRGGKTYSACADDVLTLIRRHPYREWLYADRPRRLRVIASDFDRGIAQTILPYFQQFIPEDFLIKRSWEASYSKSEHMLYMADGGVCSFMSYEQDPDKFQSVSLDHIHFDEEPPHPIWKESMARIIDTGGTWTLSLTPVKQLEWMEDTIIQPARDAVARGERYHTEVFDLFMRDNTHLPTDAIDQFESTLTEEEKAIRMRGEYTGSDKVFPIFTGRYPYVIPHDAFMRRLNERDWLIYESMDHGLASPSVWNWTAVHRNGSIVTFRSLYEARVSIDVWVARVKEVRRQIGAHLGYGEVNEWVPAATYGDPAIGKQDQAVTQTSIQQEYALRGIFIATGGIVAARTGNQGIGLAKMNGYLQLSGQAHISEGTGQRNEPWWQITDWAHPSNTWDSCAWGASEMRRARLPKQTANNKEQQNPREQIRDKDNHFIDAEKYLFISHPDLRGALGDWTPPEDHTTAMMAAMGTAGFNVGNESLPYDPDAGSFTSWAVTSGDADNGMNMEY